MTKDEFEKRTGTEVTDNYFEKIHRIYMAAGDRVDKDVFCRMYKSRNDESWFVVNQMAETIDTQSAIIKKQKQDEDKIADFLIKQAEQYSSAECRQQAINMLGEREYLKRKLSSGFILWEADKELLIEILNA